MGNEFERLEQKVSEGNLHLSEIETQISNIDSRLIDTNERLKVLDDFTDIIMYILIISFVVWLVSPIFSDFNQVRHWDFVVDMNGDGRESIRDLWLHFHWAFFYPGDWIIQYLTDTTFGKYWELSSNDYGGLLSALLSFVVIFTPIAGVAAFFTRNTPDSIVKNISIGIVIVSALLVAFFVYLMIFVFIAMIVFS
jgi:hypothetical protein